MPDFLPTRDGDLRNWANNASTLISAMPADFGVPVATATSFAAVVAAYDEAYLLAVDPVTRTKITVAAKDTARANLTRAAREISKLVEGTATVTDAQKLSLGLNVRAPRTPINPPTVSPDIDIVVVDGNVVKLKLHDSQTLRRGKPAGVHGAAVFSFVGDEPPTTEAGWRFEGNTNQTLVTVQFPPTVEPGSKVWFTAFWFNPRSQSGPAATPISTRLAGGSAMAA